MQCAFTQQNNVTQGLKLTNVPKNILAMQHQTSHELSLS